MRLRTFLLLIGVLVILAIMLLFSFLPIFLVMVYAGIIPGGETNTPSQEI